MRLLDRLLVLTPGVTDRDNPLEPTGQDPRTWLAVLLDLIREHLFLRDATLNLLHSVILGLYTRMGVLDGGVGYPTLQHLLEALQRIRAHPGSRQAAYVESALNRVEGLIGALRETVLCVRGFAPRELAREPVTYAVRNLSGMYRQFYCALKVARLRMAGLYERRAGLRHLLVFDEAHLLYNEAVSHRADLGEPYLCVALRTSRVEGLGFLLSTQTHHLIPAPVTANVNVRVAFRTLHPEDQRSTARSMGLTRDQMPALGRLPFREAVVVAGEQPTPTHVRVREAPYEARSAEGEAALAERLAGLAWTPLVEPGPEVGATPWGSERRSQWMPLLAYAREHPDWTQTDVKRALKVSGRVMQGLLEELETVSYIKRWPIAFGSQGRPGMYIEVLPPGYVLLGLDPKKDKPKHREGYSGWLALYRIAKKQRAQGWHVLQEVVREDKSIDLIRQRPDGPEEAVELETRPDRHAVVNCRRDLEVGMAQVTVVAMSKDDAGKLREILRAGLTEAELDRVEVKLVKEMI